MRKKKICWSRISITAYGHTHIRILDRGMRISDSRFVNVWMSQSRLSTLLNEPEPFDSVTRRVQAFYERWTFG